MKKTRSPPMSPETIKRVRRTERFMKKEANTSNKKLENIIKKQRSQMAKIVKKEIDNNRNFMNFLNQIKNLNPSPFSARVKKMGINGSNYSPNAVKRRLNYFKKNNINGSNYSPTAVKRRLNYLKKNKSTK